MYLATIADGTSTRYEIRQSVYDNEAKSYSFDKVFSFGEDPRFQMEFPDNTVIFSNKLKEAISGSTSSDPDIILERLLFDFFPKSLQERFNQFDRTSTYPGPLTEDQKEAIEKEIHIFDRRRLYYLYYGGIDQTKLFRMRPRIFRPLLGQCRDEREYHFRNLEKTLEPGEYRNYIYAIFNLHTYFTESYARHLPEGLSEEKIADAFCEEICKLNSSPSFHLQSDKKNLDPHLVRYLVMFFDFTPRNRSFEQEFVRQFINSHRQFRWPEKKVSVSDERVVEIFGMSYDELGTLSERELTRLYRKKALEVHPDQGGDHDQFVELTEVYESLLAKVKK